MKSEMLLMGEKTGGCGELRDPLAMREVVVGERLIRYALFCESGGSRTEFGTGCRFFYTLILGDADAWRKSALRLVDIAREEAEALFIFDLLSEGGATPETAAEILDALLG